MAEPTASRGGGRTSRRLYRVGAATARRPRRIVAGWLIVLVALGLLGAGLEDRVSTRAIFIDGSATKREHDIAVDQFGSETAVVVMLRGPRTEVVRQGRRLAGWYERLEMARVISPWTGGSSVDGLRPSPGVVALVVNVRGKPDDDVTEILPAIERGVDETTSTLVRASVAGAPAVIDSIQAANERAVELGQLIAFPALIVVLLLVFRSVFAALVPIAAGGAVVLASRGLLDLVARVQHVELLAVGAMGMMALALGVDYALLIVSRFREELAKGADVAEATANTVASTGRTVVMAGSGLSMAMLVAPLVLTGDMVVSICVSVLIATVLSVLSALSVVPALLTILGTRLDRWALPARGRRVGAAAAVSAHLSRRPRLVVLPIVLFLAMASAWALTLDTEALATAQLPRHDPGRLQQEDVQRALGPGWIAPLEIAIEDEGPVTTPSNMRAFVDFQRRLERDPGIATVSDIATLAAGAEELQGVESQLAAQERKSAKLSSGLARLEDGARQSTAGLRRAADGAGRLGSGLDATGSGSEAMTYGLSAVTQGSEQLASGLDRADSGGGELAKKTAEASEGADDLTAGLRRASRQTEDIENSAGVMENAMDAGERRLEEADGAVSAVDASLDEALGSLRAMTVGRGDAEYGSTLEAVEAAVARLSGVDPQTGEETGAADSVATAVRRARSQFDLGSYLAGRQADSGEKAGEGIEKLRDGSTRLSDGLGRLSDGADELSAGIGDLTEGGQALSPALGRLHDGAERLTAGLGALGRGADGLATGLGAGSERSTLLTTGLERIGSGVERQAEQSPLDRLRSQAPRLFDSGFLYLAGIDGAPPAERRQAGSLVSLRHGGTAARMLVVSRFDPTDPRARETRARLAGDARELERRTGAEVVLGGPAAAQQDIDTALRAQTPLARLALAAVTVVILTFVLRALIVPFIAGLLNLLTVAATFGILALLFDNSLLGGPGFVDTTVLPATIVVIFGLAIDYEVFVFSRMREEYVRSGSNEMAVVEGITRTAPVVTGAAVVMIVVFVSFSISPFGLMRNFGVAQAVGVAIDAFLIRLLVIPALMRALGGWGWWMPAWFDRLLPGTPNSVAAREVVSR